MQHRAIFLSIACGFAFYTALPAQQTVPEPAHAQQRPSARTDANVGTGPFTPDQQREIDKKQRELRQKQLHDDSEKLLKLATELKDSVDKTNEHVLSLDVVKKAEEIEKLAKHIKTNMRDEAH